MKLEPGNSYYQEIAYFFKAEEMQDGGDYVKSNEYYTKAIALDASYPSYYHNRGNNFFILQRYAEAALDYQRAIKLKPGHALYHKHMADALKQMNQLIAARQSYKRAADLDGSYAVDHETFIDTSIVTIHEALENNSKLME